VDTGSSFSQLDYIATETSGEFHAVKDHAGEHYCIHYRTCRSAVASLLHAFELWAAADLHIVIYEHALILYKYAIISS
jgi:hypothetical protein